jgi:hypothetical protein
MQETETSQANAWYALAKTARWQHRYADAADLARQGFERSQLSPMNVQLAYYEANSAALLGDTSRARAALARAERSADALPKDIGVSPWSFRPNGRRSSLSRLPCAPATPAVHCGQQN